MAPVHVSGQLLQTGCDRGVQPVPQHLALDRNPLLPLRQRRHHQQVCPPPAKAVLALNPAAAIHDPLQEPLYQQQQPSSPKALNTPSASVASSTIRTVYALSDSEVVGRLSTKKEAASTVEAAVYKPGSFWSSALASDIASLLPSENRYHASNVLHPVV